VGYSDRVSRAEAEHSTGADHVTDPETPVPSGIRVGTLGKDVKEIPAGRGIGSQDVGRDFV
jgi:hypothetical protein